LHHACQEEMDFSFKQSLSLPKGLDMISGSILCAFRNRVCSIWPYVLVKRENLPPEGSHESNPTYNILWQGTKLQQHSRDNTRWYKFVSTLQNLIPHCMSN